MTSIIICPNCGSEECYPIATNIYYKQWWFKKAWWYVIEYFRWGSRPYFNIFAVCCPDCGRQGHWEDTKEKAIKVWDK